MTLEFNQVASVGVNVVSPETDAAVVAFSAAADQIGGVDAPLRPRGRRLIANRPSDSNTVSSVIGFWTAEQMA